MQIILNVEIRLSLRVWVYMEFVKFDNSALLQSKPSCPSMKAAKDDYLFTVMCILFLQSAKHYFDCVIYSLASLLSMGTFFVKVKADFCFDGYSFEAFKRGNNLLFD